MVINVVIFILGLIFGWLFTFVLLHDKKAGNLVLVDDKTEGLYMFLELDDTDPSYFKTRKNVSFEVEVRSGNSQN